MIGAALGMLGMGGGGGGGFTDSGTASSELNEGAWTINAGGGNASATGLGTAASGTTWKTWLIIGGVALGIGLVAFFLLKRK